MELFLSAGKPRSSAKTGLRRYRVGSDGSISLQCGSGTRWVAAEPDGTKANVSVVDDGYMVTVAIPWDAFGGKPAKEEMYCCYMLHNADVVNGRTVSVHETLSGSDVDKNSTWMRMPLEPDASSGISDVTVDYDKDSDSRQYNIMGQRVGDDAKGVIIVGGKKVLRR